jgi:hypothetical protein
LFRPLYNYAVEHNPHHGGELALTLGMRGIFTPDR